LFNEGNTLQPYETDKPVALEFQIELEFRNVDFLRREENRRTRRKTLGARTRTNNKLNPHMTPGQGIEAGTYWYEESALTAAPSLLPFRRLHQGLLVLVKSTIYLVQDIICEFFFLSSLLSLGSKRIQ